MRKGGRKEWREGGCEGDREEGKRKSILLEAGKAGWVCPQSTGAQGAVQATGYYNFLRCTGKATSRALRAVGRE